MSGTKKVEYGRVREFPKLKKSGTNPVGYCSFKNFRESGMKFRESGIFREFREKATDIVKCPNGREVNFPHFLFPVGNAGPAIC